MSLLLHINYGSQFIILSLFSAKDSELISSVSTRLPYISSIIQEREIFFQTLKALEFESKHQILIEKSTPNELIFKKIIENIFVSGKFIPEFISELSHTKRGSDLNKFITEERLILNWDFEKIDLIYGGKKTVIETFDFTFESLTKIKDLEKLIKAFHVKETNFDNFLRSLPLFEEENPNEEIFYGLILENLVSRLDKTDAKWRTTVVEIVLTGEVISLLRKVDQFVGMIGSSLALTGRFTFIIDKFNFINSDKVQLIEHTGEIADYLFVPEKLRNLKHYLISFDKVETPFLIEDNKIRSIETIDKETLKVSRDKKDTLIPISGNFLVIDTRNFDYKELLSSSKSTIIRTYAEWRRGLEGFNLNSRKAVSLDIDPFTYNPKEIFKLDTGKGFETYLKKGDKVNKGDKLGKYLKKKEYYLIDLSSNLDVFENFKRYLKVVDGQLIDKNQIIAERSLIGQRKKQITSEFHGKVNLKNIEDGLVEIEFLDTNKELHSPVSGEIASIIPDREINLITNTIEFPVFDIFGKDMNGEFLFQVEGRSVEGKVLYLENKNFSIYNLRKLLQVGTKGIIFESIEKDSWGKLKDFLDKTGVDFSLCVLQGFGNLPLNKGVLKKLARLDGCLLKYDHLLEVIKFYVGGNEKFSLSKKVFSKANKYTTQQNITVREISRWGEAGKILSIKENSALVEFEQGDVELISLDNLDL